MSSESPSHDDEAGSQAAPPLTEYEIQRLERLKQNELFLQSCGVRDAQNQLMTDTIVKTVPKKPPKQHFAIDRSHLRRSKIVPVIPAKRQRERHRTESEEEDEEDEFIASDDEEDEEEESWSEDDGTVWEPPPSQWEDDEASKQAVGKVKQHSNRSKPHPSKKNKKKIAVPVATNAE